MSDRGLKQYLLKGGVITYPTESIFGLGCDPNNRTAVQRILRIKGRPQRKGLILIADRFERLRRFIAPLTAAQISQMQQAWHGARPHTWVVPASKRCPKWITGRHTTIAVRVTRHPLSAQLCKSAGIALVSTSANPSGGNPAKTGKEAFNRFGHRVRIINGKTGGAKRPSTIQDLASGKILRK